MMGRLQSGRKKCKNALPKPGGGPKKNYDPAGTYGLRRERFYVNS